MAMFNNLIQLAAALFIQKHDSFMLIYVIADSYLTQIPKL